MRGEKGTGEARRISRVYSASKTDQHAGAGSPSKEESGRQRGRERCKGAHVSGGGRERGGYREE